MPLVGGKFDDLEVGAYMVFGTVAKCVNGRFARHLFGDQLFPALSSSSSVPWTRKNSNLPARLPAHLTPAVEFSPSPMTLHLPPLLTRSKEVASDCVVNYESLFDLPGPPSTFPRFGRGWQWTFLSCEVKCCKYF